MKESGIPNINNIIKDYHIDFGIGQDQVNAEHILVKDTANFFTALTVEGVLAEIYGELRDKGILDISDFEYDQINNINDTIITPQIWALIGLMDQDVSSTAFPTFGQININASPTLPTHVVNKAYVSNIKSQLEWQDSVVDFTSEVPANPNEGERWIANADHPTWNADSIYEYNKSISAYTDPIDDITQYSYNPAEITISGGNAHLYDIGSSTVQYTDYYNDPVNFIYDDTKIEITDNAHLIPLNNGVNFAASYDYSINADYSIGDGVGIAHNFASVSNNKLDLTYDDIRYVEYNNESVFTAHTGTISLIYTPLYSGAPSSIKTILYTATSYPTNQNLVYLSHWTDGNIHFYLNNSDGTRIFEGDFPFSPTADTPYKIIATFDIDTFTFKVIINGSEVTASRYVNPNPSATISRGSCALMYVGTNGAASNTSYFTIDSLMLKDIVDTLDTDTVYDTQNPSIIDNMSFTDENYLSVEHFSENADKPLGSEIKYVISTDDGTTWMYYDTVWKTSDGTYAQASTATEIDSVINEMPVYTNSVKVKAFLHSENGFSTPKLYSITFTYNTKSSYNIGDFDMFMEYDFQTSNVIEWVYLNVSANIPPDTTILYQYSTDSGNTWNGTWLSKDDLESVLRGMVFDNIRFGYRLSTTNSGQTPSLYNVEIGGYTSVGEVWTEIVPNHGFVLMVDGRDAFYIYHDGWNRVESHFSHQLMPDSGTYTHAELDQWVERQGKMGWLDKLIGTIDPADPPISPNIGDRYAAASTGGDFTEGYIYEWNGTNWDEYVPTKGDIVYMESYDMVFIRRDTDWVLYNETIYHGNLEGILGGTHHIPEQTYIDLLSVNQLDKLNTNGDVQFNSLTTTIPLTNIDTSDVGMDSITQITDRDHQLLTNVGTHLHSEIDAHLDDVSNNPHNITRETIGVGESDNPTFDKLYLNDMPIKPNEVAKMQNLYRSTWRNNIQGFYDPTPGLPINPALGTRYISTADANGWISNYMYEWDGSEWVESMTNIGTIVYSFDDLVYYVYESAGWKRLESRFTHDELGGLDSHLTAAESEAIKNIDQLDQLNTNGQPSFLDLHLTGADGLYFSNTRIYNDTSGNLYVTANKMVFNIVDIYKNDDLEILLYDDTGDNTLWVRNPASGRVAHLDVDGNTMIGGNVTISGNLVINGDSNIINATTVEVEDNLMLLNKGETGDGVTAGEAGLEVDRGNLTNYKIVFDETDDVFKVGQTGSLQTVATRMDNTLMTDMGIAYWDNTSLLFKTAENILFNTDNLLIKDTVSNLKLYADHIDSDTNFAITTTGSLTLSTNGTNAVFDSAEVDLNTNLDMNLHSISNVSEMGVTTGSNHLDIYGSAFDTNDDSLGLYVQSSKKLDVGISSVDSIVHLSAPSMYTPDIEVGKAQFATNEIWLPNGATFTDLQDAVTTLNNGTGGTIHLPMGSITCTSSLTLTQPIKIVGHGINSSELISNVASSVVFSLSADGCEFSDFKITLDPSATYAFAFYVNSSYNHFTNLYVSGDVDTDETNSYAFKEVIGTSHNRWIDCITKNLLYGWYLEGQYGQIANCSSIGTFRGLALVGCYYVSISNHNFDSIGPSDSLMVCLYLNDAGYCTITGTTGVFSTDGLGDRYDYYITSGSEYNKIYAVTIKNTSISQNNSGTTTIL